MLRAALLCCLATGAVASFRTRPQVRGSFFDAPVVRPSLPVVGPTVFGPTVIGPAVTTSPLDGILLPADVGPAVRLVRVRYGRLSEPAAVDVLRILLERPHRRLLRAAGLQAVPAVGQRLGFLRIVLDALPPVFYASGYRSGVLSYLQSLGLSVSRAALLEPLALVDARLVCSLLQPVSVATFVNFFGSQVLQVNVGAPIASLPALPTIFSRLTALRLNPVPLGFQRISLQIGDIGGGAIGAPLPAVSALQPALSQLGLVDLVRPNTIYSGLAAYLSQQGLAVPRFVSGLSQLQIPPLPSLVDRLQLRPLLPRLRFLPAAVIRRDLVPLLAVRFYTLPRRLIRTLSVTQVITGYLGTLQVSSQATLTADYVVTLLTGFDTYIHAQAKGFRGRLWCHAIWGDW